MTRALQLVRTRAGDAFVVALLVASVVEVSVSVPDSKWVTVPLAVLWSLPLLLRRRSGLVAGLGTITVVLVASFVMQGTDDANTMFVAALAAFGVMGLHESRSRAIAGAIVGFVVLLFFSANDPDQIRAGDIFASTIFAFSPVAFGLAVRERTQRAAELARRTERLAQARDEEARIAVAEERARIARELHDVIAHSIGAMTVQAGAARTLLREDPARARRSIEAVEETGREALAETRRLLGILRRDMTEPVLTPQPGLAFLDRLVETAREDGLRVELSVEGESRSLAPGLDLAAYRIVQEGLEQARGRNGVTRTQVRLNWRADALEIAIDDDGPAATMDDGDTPIQLAVMRERIALYGGTIETACGHDGCRSLRARLPLESSP